MRPRATVGRAGGACGGGCGGERRAPGKGAGPKVASPGSRRRSPFSIPRGGGYSRCSGLFFLRGGGGLAAGRRPRSLIVLGVAGIIACFLPPSRQWSAEDRSRT